MFGNRDIVTRLCSTASQENCDSEEYDLMIEAAKEISDLRAEVAGIKALEEEIERLKGIEWYYEDLCK